MLVYDSESGQEVARLPAEGRMNGIYYDPWLKRIYITCGRELPAGFVFVYQQKDPDHYEYLGKVPNRARRWHVVLGAATEPFLCRGSVQ